MHCSIYLKKFLFSNLVKVEPKTDGEIKIEPIKTDPESKTTIKPAQLTLSIDM